ncbi:MAG: MFS transporter [Planctomycetes bacterium]|nr:MFS transporter [Planctomycetota bacterium]
MQPALRDSPSSTSPPCPALPADGSADGNTAGSNVEQHEARNLLVLAAYQVVVRVGWIFKTESIIIPAFLDLIGGAGWLRGCLPALNRLGHSVPPLLFSDRLRRMPLKRRAMAGFSLAMGAVFLVLAAVWNWAYQNNVAWMPAVFLVLYTVFFGCTGLNQLALSTTQGKLIRPTRRGRLMLIATTVGAAFAIGFAWLLLGRWLSLGKIGYVYIFSFTGVCFIAAAAVCWLLVEPADELPPADEHVRHPLAAAWGVVRSDANFRRLMVVAMLFSTVLMIFPHYVALARERLALDTLNPHDLILWVIVQNIGTAVFSLFAGPVADRRGTRVVLRTLVFAGALTPLLAIILVHVDPAVGRWLFPAVFVLLGLTPITFKTLMNYTLEISETRDHPLYISTLSLCVAAPFVISPLIGLLVDVTSFEVVFLTGAGVILLWGR